MHVSAVLSSQHERAGTTITYVLAWEWAGRRVNNERAQTAIRKITRALFPEPTHRFGGPGAQTCRLQSNKVDILPGGSHQTLYRLGTLDYTTDRKCFPRIQPRLPLSNPRHDMTIKYSFLCVQTARYQLQRYLVKQRIVSGLITWRSCNSL